MVRDYDTPTTNKIKQLGKKKKRSDIKSFSTHGVHRQDGDFVWRKKLHKRSVQITVLALLVVGDLSLLIKKHKHAHATHERCSIGLWRRVISCPFQAKKKVRKDFI